MLQKWKPCLEGDKSLCFLGLLSTYQEHFGQQRIELGSSFYVASAGRSGFTLFEINKILTVSKRETDRPKEHQVTDNWRILGRKDVTSSDAQQA